MALAMASATRRDFDFPEMTLLTAVSDSSRSMAIARCVIPFISSADLISAGCMAAFLCFLMVKFSLFGLISWVD